MKTVIIAFDNIKWVDQFRVLPPVIEYEDGKRVVFHESPKSLIIDNRVVKNYDKLIKNNNNPYPRPVNDGATIHLNRVGKAAMMQLLSERLPGDVFPNTTELDVPRGEKVVVPPLSNMSSLVVIKPAHGARGTFQMVIDRRKVNVSNLMAVIAAGQKEGVAEINELREKFPSVKFSDPAKRNSYDPESYTRAYDTLGCVIQEYHTVVKEYRVVFAKMTTGTQFIICARDQVEHDGYKQAIGSNSDVCDSFTFNTRNPDLVVRSVADVAKYAMRVVGAMDELIGSLDIALIQKGSDYVYTVFEYSNQFGIDGLSGREAKLFKEWFGDIADTVLSERESKKAALKPRKKKG